MNFKSHNSFKTENGAKRIDISKHTRQEKNKPAINPYRPLSAKKLDAPKSNKPYFA